MSDRAWRKAFAEHLNRSLPWAHSRLANKSILVRFNLEIGKRFDTDSIRLVQTKINEASALASNGGERVAFAFSYQAVINRSDGVRIDLVFAPYVPDMAKERKNARMYIVRHPEVSPSDLLDVVCARYNVSMDWARGIIMEVYGEAG